MHAMALSLHSSCRTLRSRLNDRKIGASSRSTRLVARASKQEERSVDFVHAVVAAALSGSMLIAPLIAPPEALAARSAGRAGASKFSAKRAQAYDDRAPQVNNYSSTTIIAAPPVVAPPIIAPVSPFGVSIVPIVPIPIPLPNPFQSPAPPAPVAVPAPASAETLAATEAAAAAATAAAAAATAAAVVATAVK